MKATNRALGVTTALVAWTVATAAEAHHAPTSLPSEGQGAAFVGAELGVLAVPGARYASLWARFDAVEKECIWLSARLPLYELAVTGRASAFGFGDLNAGAGIFVLRGHMADLLAAALVEMPTGDADRGLGDGHWMIHPFLGFRYTASWLTFTAIAGDAFAVGEQPEVDVRVDPHSDHELVYDVGLLAALPGGIAAGLRTGGATVLEREHRGDTPLWAGPTVVFALGRRQRLIASAQLPLTEPRRFDAKVGMVSSLMF